MEESMTDKHFGMVVEEDGQILIAFRPETISFISDTLRIVDGDLVVIESDGTELEPSISIKQLK